jgi:hypothetical protein
MATKEEGKWVVPNPQTPKTFGILNIVFGVLLLLWGLGSLVITIYSNSFSKSMLANVDATIQTKKAEREAQIKEIVKEEAVAKTAEEKAELKSRRENLEKVPSFDMNAMQELNILSDRRVLMYTYIETAAGLVLNTLMIISGIGLLLLHEWARKLALGVCWIKLLRLVVMLVVTFVLIVPVTTQRQQKFFESMNAQVAAQSGGARTAAIPVTPMLQMGAILSAVLTVFFALFAAVYPVLELWFLTRDRTLAAFLAKSKPLSPTPGTEPWPTS